MFKRYSLYIINNFEQLIATILLILMVISLILQVLARYVFHISLPWTEEVALIFFILAIYFGTSAAVIKGKHLQLEFIVQNISFKKSKILKIMSNILFISFCIYIIFPFIPVIKNLHMYNAETAITRIPKEYIYSLIPFCMLCTAFRLVQDTIRVCKRTREEWYSKSDDDFF